MHLDFGNTGCRRRPRFEVVKEGIEVRFRTFDVDFHSLFAIENPPGQPMSAGEAIHERTKPDSLHDTPHANGTGYCHRLPQRALFIINVAGLP